MGVTDTGSTTHMTVPSFCGPLTTFLYAAFGISGFVFALLGAAFSVYGRTMFISIGVSITVLGGLGVWTNYKQWYVDAVVVGKSVHCACITPASVESYSPTPTSLLR